jgi:hypothetical protein
LCDRPRRKFTPQQNWHNNCHIEALSFRSSSEQPFGAATNGSGSQEVVMQLAKAHASAFALLLLAGCASEKHATLVKGDQKMVSIRIENKGRGILAGTFPTELPTGTRVTILNDRSSVSTMKVRIDRGEFAGHEAFVDRNSIRRDE